MALVASETPGIYYTLRDAADLVAPACAASGRPRFQSHQPLGTRKGSFELLRAFHRVNVVVISARMLWVAAKNSFEYADHLLRSFLRGSVLQTEVGSTKTVRLPSRLNNCIIASSSRSGTSIRLGLLATFQGAAS